MNDLLLAENLKGTTNGFDNVILWNDFYSCKDKYIYSINLILEKNRENYKKKILKLGHKYKKNIWEKSLLNNLIDKNIETFYLSSIYNQSSFESNCLHLNLVKFLVLVDFLKKKKIKNITIKIKNNEISKVLEKYCNKKKINFTNINKNKFYTKFNKSYLLEKSRYLYKIISITKKIKFKKKSFKTIKNEIVFLDIFTHFNYSEAIQGNFVSSYWGKLYKKIEENNINVNWVHLFYPHKKLKNLSSANKLLEKINDKSKNKSHFILENFFSFKDIIKVLRIYFKLFFLFILNYRNLKRNLLKL